MAHSKRRISVPMDEETIQALDRLANSTGGSIGGTAGKFLDELKPQFLALAEAMEIIKSDPVKSSMIMQKSLLEAQQFATEEQLDMLNRNMAK